MKIIIELKPNVSGETADNLHREIIDMMNCEYNGIIKSVEVVTCQS